MDAKTQQALDILQEECAEVIVEISKCRRFGFDSLHHKTKVQHKKMLEIEIGDMLALIDVLLEKGVIDSVGLNEAKRNKIEKLKIWSGIFKND